MSAAAQRQRTEALITANVIRSRKKALKHEIKVRAADPGAIIMNPPPEMAKTTLLTFLMYIPTVGRSRAQRMIRSTTGMSPNTELRDLPTRVRGGLAALLTERARDHERRIAA